MIDGIGMWPNVPKLNNVLPLTLVYHPLCRYLNPGGGKPMVASMPTATENISANHFF